MRELENLLKDLDSSIAEIKEINHKVKEKIKSAVLTGNKINKVSAKTLMAKIPDSSEKIIEHLLKFQKTVVKGLQLKMPFLSAPSVWVGDPEIFIKNLVGVNGGRCKDLPDHLKSAKRTRKEETDMPAQLFAPKMANLQKPPARKLLKKVTRKIKIINHIIQKVLVLYILATFYTNFGNHVAGQLALSPPIVYEIKDQIHGTFPMSRNVLSELTHANRASDWAVTAYKDGQLVHLDPVSLSEVYCVNSIELVWDILEMLPFKNISEMVWAHAAASW
ncbi:hypothetical protein DSO57_1011009 [Entomophthora muscae]|uniref:Uncharacterized protein n=1 Tax=Entomophthora muscae TaxID=34485 RepID=A0ACC2S838_9FUNG|nr:hypothetical protein DSO57_1011009 [Entomophthora muscae]